jgi:ligand-binding sensor domain-containing protein
VRAIASVGSDVYFGTTTGVQKLTADGVAPVATTPRVFALASHANTLHVGTATGTFKLENGKLAAVSSKPTYALASFGERLYFGGLEGLSSIANGVLRSESDAHVRALATLDGELVAATFGAGVFRVGKSTMFSETKFATALGKDCVGTQDGVAVRGKLFARDGLPSPDVAALAVDGAKVFVGTFDRGLATIENGKVTRVSDPAIDPQINALAVDRGALWIATARGLARGENGKYRRFTEVDGLPSNDVHTVLALAKGGVLVGTSKGAAIVGTTVQPLGKKQGVTGDAVWAVAEHNGELWLGTNAGLFIGKPGAKFRRLSKLSGDLPDDWVTALAFDGETAFVGTYAGGVVQLDKTSKPLGGGFINVGGLRVIDGKLWAATMDGLFVRDGDKLRRVQKGVLGVDVTAIVQSKNGLVVATRRGLTIGLTSG